MAFTTINGGHVVIHNAANWRDPVEWERRLEVTIGDAPTGLEQRRLMRPRPRLSLSYMITVGSVEVREDMLARLRAALKSGKAAVPYHGRGSVLASSVTGGAATLVAGAYTPSPGDFLFFSNGGSAWEVRQVSAFAAGLITLDTPVARTYAAGSFVWPVLFGKITVDGDAIKSGEIDELALAFTETTSNDLVNVGGFSNTSAVAPETYMGADVFPFAPSWTGPVKERFLYDLRESSIGFGPEKFDPTEAHVTKGFDFNLILPDAQSIRDFDAFTTGGRSRGFWMASPNYTLRVVAGVSATQIDIAAESFTESLGERADLHFEFSKPGQSTQRSSVVTAAAAGAGVERVTLSPALSPAVDATWQVRALEFVRLVDDSERGVFLGEGLMDRSVRVIELPNEYAGAVAADLTHWLYHFRLESPTPVDWRVTSAERDYTAHGYTWATIPISHGTVQRSIRAERDELRLNSFNIVASPLSLWAPFPPSAKMTVEIFEDVNGVATLFYLGRIIGVDFNGLSIEAKASSWLAELDRRLAGAVLQPRCNAFLFDSNCKAVRASYLVNSTIVSVTGEVVRVNVGGFTTADASYFYKGEFQTGDLTAFESRTILKTNFVGSGVWDLTLNLPLVHATASAACKVWPGCDGLITTCHEKFSNKVNFYGFPHIPSVNPSIKPVTSQAKAGKK